jgi:hypothetical protein
LRLTLADPGLLRSKAPDTGVAGATDRRGIPAGYGTDLTWCVTMTAHMGTPSIEAGAIARTQQAS